jgi:hypothetical protein
MKIQIESGQDLIDILSDGFVTCLKIRKPIAVDWYDCAGSVGKYFAMTPMFERLVESQKINQVLVNGNDNEILKAIKEFLQLFASGEYDITIDRHKRIGHEIDQIHSEYRRSDDSNFYDYHYYNSESDNLMFTQPISYISIDKVKYYENIISNGDRPKPLVFHAYFSDTGTYEDGSRWQRSLDSPLFVLDGHHKLIAYKNLGINPELVIISRETVGKKEFENHKDKLYFEYEYFLSESAKQHIISHIPLLKIDNSHSSIEYNRSFDLYLLNSNKIEPEVLDLFKRAYISNNNEQLVWLVKKLELIKSTIENGTNRWLNYNEFSKEYGYEIYNGMNIVSKEDFDTWIVKMFGRTIGEIKSNIT